MSTISILESLKNFCKEKVTKNIKLQKPDNNVNNYELVNPAVHIGWIPPKGFLPEELDVAIPCLIVGLDEASDDSMDATYNIRISAVVYSPGLHQPDKTGKIIYQPDFQGYRDLVNLIDKTIAQLKKHRTVCEYASIQDPIKWGMYSQEQPYPFWYGWITFTVRKAAYPAAEIAKQFL